MELSLSQKADKVNEWLEVDGAFSATDFETTLWISVEDLIEAIYSRIKKS